jgi:hypothetical protein
MGTLHRDGTNVPINAEICYQLPGQSKAGLEFQANGDSVRYVQILNGKRAWQIVNGEVTELKDGAVNEMLEGMHQVRAETLVPLLDEKVHSLSLLPECKIGCRKAIGVTVKAKNHQDIDMYFDKENHLLVKTRRKGPTFSGEDLVEEYFFSDHKKTDGIVWPRKIVVYWDGKKHHEVEVTEIKLSKQIPEKEFRPE